MQTNRWVPVAIAASLSFVACSKPNSSGSSPSAKPEAPAATEKAAAKATASAAAAPAAPSGDASAAAPAPSGSADVSKRPTAKAEAKDELDKKPSSAPGGEMALVPGTDGEFQMPTGWKKADMKSGWIAYTAPDETAGICATAYAVGEDPTSKLGEVAQILNLSACEWKSPLDVTIGADEFPAKVADGVCMQGEQGEYLFYAMIPGDDLNIFVVGAWDANAPANADDKLADVIRSIHKKK